MLLLLGVWRILMDYAIAPRVMGHELEIHPLLAIFTLMVGGAVGGIVGIYLSVPLVAALRVIYRRFARPPTELALPGSFVRSPDPRPGIPWSPETPFRVCCVTGEYRMAYQPIENYGIIGNMRTIALVGMNGSIDWYCFPHFDSPSVFGAILDNEKGGRFQISPVAEDVRHKQFYWPSTNVLITRFLHADGIAELVDFMPVGLPSDSRWYHHLHRRIRCVKGSVRVALNCRPAFDYGRKPHETSVDAHGASFRIGRFELVSRLAVPLAQDGKGGVTAEFDAHGR